MNIREQDLAAIQRLGYTPEEARFLYIVATHSGYFQPRQYVTSNGLAWGKRVQRLTDKLESRGHVTWREYQDVGGVYHLFSKTLYRLIEKTDLRNRRRHSTEFIRTRLLLLDFILENPQHEYFESETDKLAYFCSERSIPKDALPVKRYEAASGAPPTVRYFVDKFPLFLDRSTGPLPPVISLSYVDPGQASLAGFAHHLQNYARLFSCLGDFAFLYIADSTANFRKAGECFSSLVGGRAGKDLVQEVTAYFERRKAWELKQYGQLSALDVESLQNAKERFASEQLERLYTSWSSGQVEGSALKRALAQKCSDVKIEFHTYLVSRRSVDVQTLDNSGGSPLHPPTSPGTSQPTSPSENPQKQEIQGHEEGNGENQNRGPNPDEAGATPPADAPCVTEPVRSLPPHGAAIRARFGPRKEDSERKN